MTPCPHYQPRGRGMACALLGDRVLAGPYSRLPEPGRPGQLNPMHPCHECRKEWGGEGPPTVLPPVLLKFKRAGLPAAAVPSLARRALNFGQFLVAAFRSGQGIALAPRHAIDARAEVCRSVDHGKPCIHYRPDGYFGLGQCNHQNCGCAMKIKYHFAAANCPLGHWGPVLPADGVGDLVGGQDGTSSP